MRVLPDGTRGESVGGSRPGADRPPAAPHNRHRQDWRAGVAARRVARVGGVEVPSTELWVLAARRRKLEARG